MMKILRNWDQIVKAYNESQKNGVSALTGLTGNSVNINQLTKGIQIM